MTRPIEESIGRALHLQATGQLDAAAAVLREVLVKAPEHPDALHFLGLIEHQRGDTVRAIVHLEHATTAAPGHVEAWNNLGSLYQLVDKHAEAEATFKRVLSLVPDFAPAHFNLGLVMAEGKRWDEAVVRFRRAAALAPDFLTFKSLGDALAHRAQWEDAAAAYRHALVLEPRSASAKKNLLRALFYLVDSFDRTPERRHEALPFLEEWLRIAPDDPMAKHTYAAFTGKNTPDRASDGYVRQTFDRFAESFDRVLSSLQYNGAEVAAEALLEAVPAARTDLVVLDAGCGTGAVGPFLRPRCASLVGVDLSEKMLDKARARNVYDTLEVAELTAYLTAHPEEFDAIVCADTVVYFGDTRSLFEAVARASRPGAVFVCTVELLDSSSNKAFVLAESGRYLHAESYLNATLAAAGLTVVAKRPIAQIRVEHGVRVPGLVITAQRRVDRPAGGS